ncbi:trypsin-like peptidase domain-containing protein [Streptomyces sp. NPDC003007]
MDSAPVSALSSAEGHARVELRGRVAGAGFLVTPNTVLTCAHVVADGEDLAVTFTERPGTPPVPARVVAHGGWSGGVTDPGDLAVLRLDREMPIAPAALAPVDAAHGTTARKLVVYGYPDGFDEGTLAEYRVTAPQLIRREWLQLEAWQPGGQPLAPGFSGAAVTLADTGEVVGMVTADSVSRDVRTGRMMPTQVMARYWPDLESLVPTSDHTGADRARLRALVEKAARAGVDCDPVRLYTAAADPFDPPPPEEGFDSLWSAALFVLCDSTDRAPHGPSPGSPTGSRTCCTPRPRSPSVPDWSPMDDAPYLVTEFVDGLTVSEVLPGLSFRVFATLVSQGTAGLRALRAHDLVRGERGPSGLLLRPDGTLLLSRFALGEESSGKDAESDLAEFRWLLKQLAPGARIPDEHQELLRLIDRHRLPEAADYAARLVAGAPWPPARSFSLLGPLRVTDGTRDIEQPSPTAQALLCMLLLRHGRRVTHDELATRLWEQPPPPNEAVARLARLAAEVREVCPPTASSPSRAPTPCTRLTCTSTCCTASNSSPTAPAAAGAPSTSGTASPSTASRARPPKPPGTGCAPSGRTCCPGSGPAPPRSSSRPTGSPATPRPASPSTRCTRCSPAARSTPTGSTYASAATATRSAPNPAPTSCPSWSPSCAACPTSSPGSWTRRP